MEEKKERKKTNSRLTRDIETKERKIERNLWFKVKIENVLLKFLKEIELNATTECRWPENCDFF